MCLTKRHFFSLSSFHLLSYTMQTTGNAYFAVWVAVACSILGVLNFKKEIEQSDDSVDAAAPPESVPQEPAP